MKIAIIFPHITGPYGGERLLINLSKNFSNMGHQVNIYTHKINSEHQGLVGKLNTVQGFYIPTNNHSISSLLDLLFMPFLVTKIKRDYDIVIAIGWQSLFGAYLLRKLFKSSENKKFVYYCLEPPRFVYDLHSDTTKRANILAKLILKLLKGVVRTIDRNAINSININIAISEWTASQIQKIYKKKAVVIYPGVEIQRFKKFSKSDARRQLGIPQTGKIFLSVSKLHRRKRLDQAIEIFLQKQDNESLFYIIGTGPERKNIEEIIRNHKTKKIILLGELSDKEVVLHMKAADYFIFTAKNEPFGIAPLEAKVAGCKIIPQDTKFIPNDWQSTASEFLLTINRYKHVQ